MSRYARSRVARKIVCLGGGTIIPNLLLKPLKKKGFQITGITSMIDSGYSAGQIRDDFNVLPPGDIRRHVLALSSAPEWKKNLWSFRFGREDFGEGHIGHPFSNVFMAGLEISFKNYRKVIEFVSDFMELKDNQALPMIITQSHIIAELANGEIIKGEWEIDALENHDRNLKIKKVYLETEAKIFPEAKKAILEADLILVGPGDLYSSIVPCFLPNGATAVLKKAKAKKILISNSLAKLGETNGFTTLEFANEVEKYMGTSLDYVLYHNKPIDKELMAEYQKENPQICGLIAVDEDLPKDKFIGADILQKDKLPFDSKKIISNIFKIIGKK
ncbi:MAG: 2-phospho-L-lactate transferase CofD family protein [Candidatus Paceibacterota bacterium]